MAALSYLGILVLIPLLSGAKNDPFVKFHIKQGLVLLICWVVGSFLIWIPIIGQLFVGLPLLILFIIGLVNALSGKESELPVVGKFAAKFNV